MELFEKHFLLQMDQVKRSSQIKPVLQMEYTVIIYRRYYNTSFALSMNTYWAGSDKLCHLE